MITITVNGKSTQAQIADRVSVRLAEFSSHSLVNDEYSVRAVVPRTWISVPVFSIILEVPIRRVSSSEPGLTAVVTPR